jgi:hypothetical protein
MNPATKPATDQLVEPAFNSEFPTEPHAEHAAQAARAIAATLAEDDVWCDSEAPTGVAAERPLLPRPARTPQV